MNTQPFHCTWCGAERTAGTGPCPARCDRPPGWTPHEPYGEAYRPARAVVLTDAGYRAAGYAWTPDRGYVKEARP